MSEQRLRIRFAREEAAMELSPAETRQVWERALRQAELPLAYSEGRHPQPRMALAAPLPAGMTSEAELLDAYLTERVAPAGVGERLAARLPAGFAVLDVREVPSSLPAVQTEAQWAEYRVVVHAQGPDALRAALDAFLARDTFPWEQQREKRTRRYDLRALVGDLWLEQATGAGDITIGMRLREGNSGSGRPDQVLAALGLSPPLSVRRTRLMLANTSPTLLAWRRVGRFQV